MANNSTRFASYLLFFLFYKNKNVISSYPASIEVLYPCYKSVNTRLGFYKYMTSIVLHPYK